MASKGTVARMFALLHANWPREEYTAHTVQLYERCLGDIDDEVLEAATLQCIASKTFFPRVAEIREAAYDIICQRDELPTPYEAWGMVLRWIRLPRTIMRDGKRWGKAPLPEIVQAALDGIGGVDLVRFSDNITADRARFVQAYEGLVERRRKRVQTLPQVRELAARIAQRIEGGEQPRLEAG